VKDLDRDVTLEPQVMATQHSAHAPDAEHAVDSEPSEDRVADQLLWLVQHESRHPSGAGRVVGWFLRTWQGQSTPMVDTGRCALRGGHKRLA